jgi:hypothetical protein
MSKNAPLSMSEEALFKALCQVQESQADKAGPAAAFAKLFEATGVAGAKIQGAKPAQSGDNFPDFKAENDTVPAPSGPSAPPMDQSAMLEALLGSLGEYRTLLERYNRDFDQVFAKRAAGEVEAADETLKRLTEAQRVLVKYPIAAQAAFAALVREGREFSKSEEGAKWRSTLARSPMFAKARTMFEGLAGGMVNDSGSPLPSTYLHAFVRALDRDLESVLADAAGVKKTP